MEEESRGVDVTLRAFFATRRKINNAKDKEEGKKKKERTWMSFLRKVAKSNGCAGVRVMTHKGSCIIEGCKKKRKESTR